MKDGCPNNKANFRVDELDKEAKFIHTKEDGEQYLGCPICGEDAKILGQVTYGGRLPFSSLSKADQRLSLKKRAKDYNKSQREMVLSKMRTMNNE
jgi:hypothetical protein